MATGITPKSGVGGAPPRPATGGRIELCYAEKKDASEVLATTAATLRQVSRRGTDENIQNRLYYGENLSVLAALLQDDAMRGKVRLIYLDPPYSTGLSFHSRSLDTAYDDLLSGSHYVEFLRQRLILMRQLLSDDGSVYLHLDKNMAFTMKIIMDEVFGPKNFRSWITRKKCNPKNYTSRSYGNVADYVLFYTKSDDYVWHRPVDLWTPEKITKEYPCIDADGRRYKKVPLHAPGTRNGATGQAWRGKFPPPGKHWQYVPDTLDEMDEQQLIYWSPTGNPRRKVYLDDSAGVPVQDIWLDFKDAHNQNIKITGYPTEKNPHLLRRIIEASSNVGDLVLDCFAGSGTTLGVASETGRRWIGIDNSPEAMLTMLQRFQSGTKRMGTYVTPTASANATSQQSLFSGDNHLINDAFVDRTHVPFHLFTTAELSSATDEADFITSLSTK